MEAHLPEDRPLSEATRMRLRRVRQALLSLHKTILDVERTGYERDHGRVAPGALLQLLMNDPRFGWFRPISEVVVQVDEMLESEEPVDEREAEALLREIRSLLKPSVDGEEFSIRYHQALQADPATVLAHAEIARLLQTNGRR